MLGVEVGKMIYFPLLEVMLNAFFWGDLEHLDQEIHSQNQVFILEECHIIDFILQWDLLDLVEAVGQYLKGKKFALALAQ